MANLDPNLDPRRTDPNRGMDYRPVDRGVGAGAWVAGVLALILVVGAIFYMVNRSGDTTTATNTSPPAATTGAAPGPATTGSGDASAPMRGPTAPPASPAPATPPAQSR